jgi:hypothetical protein
MLHAQISQYPLLSLNATTAAVLTFLVLCDKILDRCDKILARMASLARTIRRVKKEWNAP